MVAASQRMFVFDLYFRHERIQSLLVYLSEVFAERFQIFMTRMFHIVLVIGIVHHALQVAFVVAHLHLQLENIFLHILSYYLTDGQR